MSDQKPFLPPGPRTTSQEIAAQLPTMPAPKDARVEPETPQAMRKVSGEILVGELRAVTSASVAPKADWASALEAHAADIRNEIKLAEMRSSQDNLEQDARTGLALAERDRELSDHDERIKRIESTSALAASSSASAASSSAQVEKFLSGFLPPKAVGALLGVMGLLQLVLSIVQAIRGNK